ncbi:MAG: hypothetical protein DRO12_01500 [Thermoprotei archaeon]|nr:MAG: hypothetical protein DRO12_01500 [Thermoprotei archaeon]
MVVIEGIESIGLLSVWMLEPRLPELLLELRKRGYATARVKPKSLGGYDITFIEPNVAAIKGSTYILYNPGRRTLTIEGSNVDELLLAFNEVEEILKNVGSDPAKGVLFYELQVKAKASGGRWALKKIVKVDDLLGLDLLAVPVSFVSVEGDPNSTRWFHLDVRPLWTSWSDEKAHYEVVLVYRDSRERLLNVLRNIDKVPKEVLERVNDALEINT